MAYPQLRLPHPLNFLPVPANDGTKVNVKTLCVLLQLFSLKPEEPVSALFRQKAA